MERSLKDRAESSDKRKKGQRLELSIAQVAGSALAAVAAAVLASQLGVYGTIAGAGVVSVIATCGGTVFQHLFRRTGEQLRDATVHTAPRRRKGPVPPRPAVQAEPVSARGSVPAGMSGTGGQFGAATTYGTRLRGWRRPVLAAVAAFVVAMVGITAVELISGRDLSGGRGTTVGSVVGGDRTAPPRAPRDTPPAVPPENRIPDDGSTPPSPSVGVTRTPGDGRPHDGRLQTPVPRPSSLSAGTFEPPGDGTATTPPPQVPTPTPSGSGDSTSGSSGVTVPNGTAPKDHQVPAP